MKLYELVWDLLGIIKEITAQQKYSVWKLLSSLSWFLISIYIFYIWTAQLFYEIFKKKFT